MPKNDGFTLVELLIVIAILGVLATLAFLPFTKAQQQARDAKRKSDLNQYRSSLEIYANKNSGLYSSRTSSSGERASQNLCTDLELTNCPEDPKYTSDPTQTYLYQADGSGAGAPDATKYVLWAKMETAPVSYFIYCSNGKAGSLASVSISGGICPL